MNAVAEKNKKKSSCPSRYDVEESLETLDLCTRVTAFQQAAMTASLACHEDGMSDFSTVLSLKSLNESTQAEQRARPFIASTQVCGTAIGQRA